MNRTYALSLALVFVAAGNAIADDITIDPNPFVSTASRAQVKEEMRQFRRAGVIPWADEYNPLTHFRGSKTRAEVTAEFLASREATLALSSEDSGSSYLARMNAPAMRRGVELARME